MYIDVRILRMRRLCDYHLNLCEISVVLLLFFYYESAFHIYQTPPYFWPGVIQISNSVLSEEAVLN